MKTLSKTAALAALAASLVMTGPAMARDIRPHVPVDPGDGYMPPGGDGEIDQGNNGSSIEQVLADEARRQLRKLNNYLEERYGDHTGHRQ